MNESPSTMVDRNFTGEMDMSTLLLETTEPAADFNPGREDRCYCGSGQLFWSCCGSSEIVRPPPFGLFMFENYIEPDVVAELREFADGKPGQPLQVIDLKSSTPDNIVKVPDERRIVEHVPLTERREQINAWVHNIFEKLAKQYVQQTVEWYEVPELMRYRAGGHYVRHADSQNLDTQTGLWNKVVDRDLSLLIYLNEDFEGGELSFYKLNYQIRPRAGAVIMFPSDQRFLHQAEIVKKGVRYAIVSWAAVKGIPKVAKQPPNTAILLS